MLITFSLQCNVLKREYTHTEHLLDARNLDIFSSYIYLLLTPIVIILIYKAGNSNSASQPAEMSEFELQSSDSSSSSQVLAQSFSKSFGDFMVVQ